MNNLKDSLVTKYPGEKLKLDYQKDNLLGKGTFGEVYSALDQRTGGLMAVKSIKLTKKTDPEKRNQELKIIENEINLLKQLDHPNIVKYYCMQRNGDNNIDIVLEMVSGGSLRQLLDRFGSFHE